MLEERQVHELAARHGDPLITSFYLDVDGRRYPRPTDYQPVVTQLCHAARLRAAELGAATAAAVDADLDRIRAWIDAGIDRATTRGVALFSCAGQGWLEVVPVPVPVRNHVSFEPRPNVAQLLAVVEHRRPILVVLVDRRQGRILQVEPGGVTELATVVDEPERAVDTDVELGSWEHRREEEARRHFRRVAAAALEQVRRRRAEHVVLGGPGDDVARLEGCLDRAVAERVAGTTTVPVTAGPAEIGAAVADTARELERRREEALVEELHERAPRHERAVMGLPAVMAALAEHRVGTLVVARDFRAAGARCPACGHVGVACCQCPECGTPSTEVDDIVDVAISQALAQDADVEFCEGTDLDFFGGIGALERF
jgi:peptide chain release factor subunit 1